MKAAPTGARRNQPTVVLDMPEPALADGNPVLPKHWAQSGVSATLLVGPQHIHAIKDPTPVWDPATSGWKVPPPKGAPPMSARWSVLDLPDPARFPGGWYWLGDPSGADGTLHQAASTHQWGPDKSTPHAPSWRSIFPYKPSVVAIDHWLYGGGVVHHPRGVNFNSHFIEHMWMDWGKSVKQPFTWVIAAAIASYPDANYVHNLLDAGRNPDAVHFPRLRADQVGTPRSIKDGLVYQSHLAASAREVTFNTSTDRRKIVRARHTASLRPKMFFASVNGAHTATGSYSPGQKLIGSGTVDTSPSHVHRYYVLGRQQNFIAQTRASHLLIFEIRFWNKALTIAELDAQYKQLSSTYQFDRYKAL